MFVRNLGMSLVFSLVLSGFSFGQVYEKELQAYDLPGLQKKLELVDATVQSEPVVAYFLSIYSQLKDRPVTKALEFLQALKTAKADMNLPVKGTNPQSPLVVAVRNRVDHRLVEWLIANGARFGSSKTPARGVFSQDLPLIDFALFKGDYRTAKALIGLNATLPVKDRVPIGDDYQATVPILKDDLPAVKKRILEAGTGVGRWDWRAAIGAASPKICDFFLAVSNNDLNARRATMDGAWDGVYPLLTDNPEFLTKLLVTGYSFQDDEFDDLYRTAIHHEQFDTLPVLMANDKNSIWLRALASNDFVESHFDVFLSITDNFKRIIVPEGGDLAEDQGGPYHRFLYGERSDTRDDDGIIVALLHHTDPETIKTILKTIPPTPQQLAHLRDRNPDLAQTLVTLDDTGAIKAGLDTPQ